MGNKLQKDPSELTEDDFKFFKEKTGITKEKFNEVLMKFSQDNPDGKLDRTEFKRLYTTFRKEPAQNLNDITNFIFNGKFIK
jgi:hypothetical protein